MFLMILTFLGKVNVFLTGEWGNGTMIWKNKPALPVWNMEGRSHG